jgi:hypothetical protein
MDYASLQYVPFCPFLPLSPPYLTFPSTSFPHLNTANDFNYIPSVPLSVASKLLHHLNLVGEHGLLPSQNVDSVEYRDFLSSFASLAGADEAEGDSKQATLLAAAESATLETHHRRSLALSSLSSSPPSSSSSAFSPSTSFGGKWRTKPFSEGYLTLDACGGSDPAEQLGDDTAHRPFRSARQPVFVATSLPVALSVAEESEGEEETVDVVFFDFITPDIISALNVLDRQSGRRYGLGDVEKYVEGISANTLMETYAKRAWQ